MISVRIIAARIWPYTDFPETNSHGDSTTKSQGERTVCRWNISAPQCKNKAPIAFFEGILCTITGDSTRPYHVLKCTLCLAHFMQFELYWFVVVKILLISWIRLLVDLYEPESSKSLLSQRIWKQRKREERTFKAELKQDFGKDQDFSPKSLFCHW